MTNKVFVDTNILMYAHDKSAGMKHFKAKELIEQLWQTGEGVLSTQVLQELCINLRRKVKHSIPMNELRALVEDYLRWEVVVNTPASVLQALDFESRYKVSFWDALVLQAADFSGATVLYSEDLASNQHYGSIQVVNPFK